MFEIEAKVAFRGVSREAEAAVVLALDVPGDGTEIDILGLPSFAHCLDGPGKVDGQAVLVELDVDRDLSPAVAGQVTEFLDPLDHCRRCAPDDIWSRAPGAAMAFEETEDCILYRLPIVP